jgi:hypothetical protein
MFKFRSISGILALAMAAGACFGEDVEPAKFYKLEFVVKELDGAKTLNSRAYSMVVSSGNAKGSIRTDSRIPCVSAKGPDGNTTQFQQVNVGVNIDAMGLKEVQNKLSFTRSADISTMSQEPSGVPSPVVRTNRWSSTLIVPFKKPTVVLSSDSVDSKTQMQLEVTATPIP